ncbi:MULTISPECIES: hypothetical protein [Actinomyces]|uniref:Uncharacterized protein n=1 Tax=Actinomyces respiraculi TaxID=2744574 RepID=A0A7T0LJ41_9ACTO|nr:MULTISPECIES: hypothetical protein [Actinomyces]QPL04657.1 hypothetical protein ID810_07600 [Actinomyces respiraculi]
MPDETAAVPVRDTGTHGEPVARDALYREFFTALCIHTDDDVPPSAPVEP